MKLSVKLKRKLPTHLSVSVRKGLMINHSGSFPGPPPKPATNYRPYPKPLSQSSEWLVLANSYIRKGWSIIPVGSDKRPLVKWKQYQDRFATTKELQNWSKLTNLSGFAVVTGKLSKVLVLDIDQGSNFDISDLPETLSSKTGSGGSHYFFIYPDNTDIGNFAGFEERTDIRGEGGYAILPPSLHESGNRYEWSSHKNAKLANVPQHLLEKLNSDSIDQLQLKVKNIDVFSGVMRGSRNNAATKVIGKLLTKYPEDEWKKTAWP